MNTPQFFDPMVFKDRRRFKVVKSFGAWPEGQWRQGTLCPMEIGWDLFANPDQRRDNVVFMLELAFYEVERQTFFSCVEQFGASSHH